MEKSKIEIILPKEIITLFNKNLFVGVIQFGSSLFNKKAIDIDLAIIIKKGNLKSFINQLNKVNKIPSSYDISLILEEELVNVNTFSFGCHGSYLVESFRKGKTLLGKNPFILFPIVSIEKIKNDIYERMKEYIYILRKSYFNDLALKKFNSRYNKFLKLSLFLLSKKYDYPEIMFISDNIIISNLSNLGYNLKSDKQFNVEILWKEIIKRYL